MHGEEDDDEDGEAPHEEDEHDDEDLIQATPEQFPNGGNWARKCTRVLPVLALVALVGVAIFSEKSEKRGGPAARSEIYTPTVESIAVHRSSATPSDSGRIAPEPRRSVRPAPPAVRAEKASTRVVEPAIPELPVRSPYQLVEARALLLTGAWPTDDQATEMVLVYALVKAYADTTRMHTNQQVDRVELKELKRLFLLALREHEQSALALLLEQADAGRK